MSKRRAWKISQASSSCRKGRVKRWNLIKTVYCLHTTFRDNKFKAPKKLWNSFSELFWILCWCWLLNYSEFTNIFCYTMSYENSALKSFLLSAFFITFYHRPSIYVKLQNCKFICWMLAHCCMDQQNNFCMLILVDNMGDKLNLLSNLWRKAGTYQLASKFLITKRYGIEGNSLLLGLACIPTCGASSNKERRDEVIRFKGSIKCKWNWLTRLIPFEWFPLPALLHWNE